MLPQFIIIGGQKCASTYLQHILIQHPDVYMPKQEIPFFQKPDYDPDSIEDYFTKLNNKEGKIFGIKRPDYLGTVGVEKRIAKHLPDVKLVIIIRNPIDRFRSAYFHYMKMGFIPITGLNEGVNLLLSGKYDKNYPRSKELIGYGFYYKHISRYLMHFRKENVRVFFYDDLKKEPQTILDNLLNFIGASSKVKLDLSIRPQLGIYSLNRLRVRKMFLPFLYSYNQEFTRLEKRKGMAGILGKFFLLLDSVILSKVFKQERPKFNSIIKKQLINIYKRDILELQKKYDKNLASWLS